MFPLTLWLIGDCPNFFLTNCAQTFKKTFMCPKFQTNPVLKHTKCHISTNFLNFLKLCLLYCQELFALAPTNHRFAEKNLLSGNTGSKPLATVSPISLSQDLNLRLPAPEMNALPLNQQKCLFQLICHSVQ